jgi:hypothetical protein
MDQELKQYLDGKFAEQDAKFARDLERVEARFAGDLERVETRFARDLERVETALLTEFHKWASPADMRTRTHAAALRAIDLEMESITEGVQKLEDRH